jgi:hypothetical protein
MVGSGTTSAQPPDCFATLGSGFLRLLVALTDFETDLRLVDAGFFAIGLGFAGRRSFFVAYCDAVGRLAVVDFADPELCLLVVPPRAADPPTGLLPCDIARLAMFILFHYDYVVFHA